MRALISKCYYNSFNYVNWIFHTVSKCQFVSSYCFLLNYFVSFSVCLIKMFYKSQQNVWFGFFSISLENFHLNNLHCDFLLCYFECSFGGPPWFEVFYEYYLYYGIRFYRVYFTVSDAICLRLGIIPVLLLLSVE